MVWWSEIQYALGDALGLCRFSQKFNSVEHLGLEEFARLIFFATGMEFSTDELMKVGERIVTLERLFLQAGGGGPFLGHLAGPLFRGAHAIRAFQRAKDRPRRL